MTMRLPENFRPRSPAGALGTGPAQPPPPPPVAVAPPPPPPVARGSVATPEEYEPRDPSFYFDARCKFAAALQPLGFDPNERDQAEQTAHLCAVMLDVGAVPKGFMVPAVALHWHAILEKEVLDAATAGTVLSYAQHGASAHAGEKSNAWEQGQPSLPRGSLPAPTMTEGQKAAARLRLESYTKEHGVPSREEATSRNAAALAAMADLSERIRSAALDAAVIRLTAAGVAVTGARPTEALGIVAYEIDRAYRFAAASRGMIPTKSLAAMTGKEASQYGERTVPFPANIALAIALASMFGADDAEEPNEENTAPAHGAP